jgi:hypothetical protein
MPSKRVMDKQQEEWLGAVPPAYRSTYERAMTEKSYVAAIKAMCHSCNGYDDAFNRTRECHIRSCPLWPYRFGSTEWPSTSRSSQNLKPSAGKTGK